MLTDDPKQMEEHRTFQQVTVWESMEMQVDNEDLLLTHMVRQKGYPNRWGAKIPLKPKWNLQRMQQLLQNYEDKEVVEWMKYGWPAGRLPTLPQPKWTFKNSPVTG